ncbi:uncharacterized protein LOC114724478 [Neltuma alba]|uniref:uncharacterized protein LOC114724478 n=1 Tax=Neltuma alba TaxID=207710 RepID=UPI0010A4BA60|nr:uncharacterized protein LOC114724478 [Prosopis alba]
MAWDLWSSTHDEAVRNSNDSEHLGRQYDFYFDCEHDIMEERALNEKSCIQVLKNLITKEDAEIEELEKDLSSLQNELIWAEHKNWPEICCNALTEKINWLDVSLRSLKNDHPDSDRIQLLLRNEPAGTLDEILMGTLGDYCQDNCGQVMIATNDLKLSLVIFVNDQKSNVDIGLLRLISVTGFSLYFSLSGPAIDPDIGYSFKEPLAKIVWRSADFGAIRSVVSPSNGMNLLGTSDSKVLVNGEVRRSQLVTIDEGQILNSVSSKGKEIVLKEIKQEGETVKDVSADVLLDSNFCASQRVKSESSNFDKMQRGFAPKTAQRDSEKEMKDASTQDCEGINPLQVDGAQKLCLAAPESWNRKSLPHVMKFQSASLVNAKSSGLSSMLELQTKSALFTGPQLTDKAKSQALCLKPEPTVDPRKPIASKPGENHVELIPNSSLKVTCKRPRKSRAGNDGAKLIDSLSGKVAKRSMQLEQHITEYAVVPYDSKFSELQKKRVVCKSTVTAGTQNSLVTIDSTKSNAVVMVNGNHEDPQNSLSCSSVDSHNRTSALRPAGLKNLTLNNLRVIAKQHNVKKYYRMAKGPLLEQLTRILGGW